MSDGFSHVGLSTHDMDETIRFYEGVLGLPLVGQEKIRIQEGGTLRQAYFQVGEGQFIVFMEPRDVPGISPDYDTGINGALGVPGGMYHVALRVLSLDDLESRRKELESRGVDVSAIINLGHAKSIFFSDPNGVQLEISCQTREFTETDLLRESVASIAL